MTMASTGDHIGQNDWLQALAFAQRNFEHWHQRGMIRDEAFQAIRQIILTIF